MGALSIPTIDISCIATQDPVVRKRAAAEIDEACRTIGFFTIVGHGVPEELIADVHRQATTFFAQPADVKSRWRRPASGVSRGHSALNDRALSYTGSDRLPDTQESFAIGPLRNDDPNAVGPSLGGELDAFLVPNVWPDQPSKLKAAFQTYYRTMEDLSGQVLGLCAQGLGLPADFFADKIDRHLSTMRVVRYPADPRAKPGQVRASEHTDSGTITILRGDDVPGGLEVKTRDGDWIAVHPRPDSFACNVGDLLMRWTGDRWISTPHRVANPPDLSQAVDRLSIVYFQNVNADAIVEGIESISDRPTKYPPITFGEFYLARRRRIYNNVKSQEAV